MVSLALEEYLRLLHLPTTSCILAFAVIGGTFAPIVYLDRLLWLLLELFLLGGVAANYFDEIQGRPWHTKILEIRLWIIGFLALFASSMIGIHLTLTVAPWFWVFVTIWAFFSLAYDLELFNGRFHNTRSLAISWGSVCLGSYYLQSLTLTPSALLLSIINGCAAGCGRELYEEAKPFYKDKDPRSLQASKSAWTLLKMQILSIDLYAVAKLISWFFTR